MSSSIIDFVNCHTEKENGDNKYINDKFLDVKETNSKDTYITNKLNLKGVVSPNSVLATDSDFNVVSDTYVLTVPSYFSYNNGVNPFIIPAGNQLPIDFATGGNFLEISSNMTYSAPSVLSINEDGFFLFNFSCLISASAAASGGYFELFFQNQTQSGARIFEIGKVYNMSDVNDKRLISSSFFTSNRFPFRQWTIQARNLYPTQSITITDINTTITKMYNFTP